MEQPIKVTPVGDGRDLLTYANDDPEERQRVFLREADGTEIRLFKAQSTPDADGKVRWTLVTVDGVDVSDLPTGVERAAEPGEQPREHAAGVDGRRRRVGRHRRL
jgi:hypothetical protein